MSESGVLDQVAGVAAKLAAFEQLELAAATRPMLHDIDLPALADHWFTTFEGSFLLAQAVGDPACMRRQLAHLRQYLELLSEFEVPSTATNDRHQRAQTPT